MIASDIFKRDRSRKTKPLPKDKGLPIIGHTIGFLTDPIGMGVKMYNKHGPAVNGGAFGLDSVFLSGPDANQFVLRNQDKAFSNCKGWEFFIGPFFKRGIMLLDFDEHRFHRGIMQAAFKKPVLIDYLKRMNPAIDQGIERWQTGADFHVLPHLKQLTLDIATDVFMGEKLGAEADRINQAFVDCVLAGTAVMRFPIPGGRWKRGLESRRILEEFFRSRIAVKRANPGDDLFSRLCLAEDENGTRFSDEDVVNHMIFLMMAAHDTSTITLSSIFYHLAKYPEWQEKVREEAQALNKDQLDHADLSQMEVMDRVMKESLRLLSPVHVIPRKTVKEVEFNGYTIPKDTYIIVSPIVTHHMEQWWQNPKRFDPDRFSAERNEHKQHPYQYVPFGGGAHMCIGLHFAEMQIKAILHQVILRYRWSVSAAYQMPVNFTSLPTPKDKLPVRLERLDPAPHITEQERIHA